MQIGKYCLLEELGAGGMGVVYKAWDTHLQRVVALKMIRAGVFAGSQAVDRFLLESQALARLKHPHILAIHDAGYHEGQPYFVAEYLSGKSLAQNLERFQGDPAAAALLVEKIAAAVQQLHEHNMLHRDLKPGNVLLDDNGEPHLSDFGLVKLLDYPADLTQPEQRVGTPAYMAPESTGLVELPIGPATDVWALGVILYELATGRRPFPSDSADVYARILHDDPVRPSLAKAGLDRRLESIILKCLEKEPARRFATAQELAEELGRWRRGEPLHTRPERWPRSAWRWLRRRPAAAVALILGLTAVILVPVVLFLRDPERPWREIRAEMAAGQAVVLIPAKGEPRYHRWVYQNNALTARDAEGRFTVQGWKTAMLELAQEVPWEEYRIRCKIRHDTGERDGTVGVYFATKSARQDRAQLLYGVRYNDVVNQAALLRALRPPARRLPDGNPVSLFAGAWADLSYDDVWKAELDGASFRFSPAGVRGRKWRDIRIEVRSEEVLAWFDGAGPARLNVAAHQAKLAEKLKDFLQRDSGRFSFFAQFEPIFPRRGACGLFVDGAAAAFADYSLEPLSQREQP